ncbi:hypothetical protein HRI_000126100 [Hibiscus trionum]|uniref:Legume lectin domain-containing protein n=1 Tax=Hibiscus trionum TaxID=183268 RepID=A0A9W7GUC6_HIBTR|nr:hypothetical protein HRI_000126100 [Hibiscus trionum]
MKGLVLWLTGFSILHLMVVGMAETRDLKTKTYSFRPFDSSYYDNFTVIKPATISNDALQITPDSVGNFSLNDRSGRILFNQTFKLWDGDFKKIAVSKVASFNTSFLINVFRVNNSVLEEGVTFVITSDTALPPGSSGQYLGLRIHPPMVFPSTTLWPLNLILLNRILIRITIILV